MTQKFPSQISELQEELVQHSKAGRLDDLFRFVIMHAQVGDLAKNLSHDQNHNPGCRPHGTKDSEKNECGHAIVQLMTYVALRGYNLQECIDMALVNLREEDFEARTGTDSSMGVEGTIASRFSNAFKSPVWNIRDTRGALPQTPELYILVAQHTATNIVLSKFAGIITDHGGMNCHAAIIAREFGIPCLVGTGDATEKFRTGDIILMDCHDKGTALRLNKQR